MKTTIICTKDLYNGGRCFTKGNAYEVSGRIATAAGLMDKMTTNDMGEAHIIGNFWRNFKIVS